jgi:hypothetical protein
VGNIFPKQKVSAKWHGAGAALGLRFLIGFFLGQVGTSALVTQLTFQIGVFFCERNRLIAQMRGQQAGAVGLCGPIHLKMVQFYPKMGTFQICPK